MMKPVPRSNLLQIDFDRLVDEASQTLVAELWDRDITSYRLSKPLNVRDTGGKLLKIEEISVADGSILLITVKELKEFKRYTVALNHLEGAVEVAIDILADMEEGTYGNE
jgi:hypothetical protein